MGNSNKKPRKDILPKTTKKLTRNEHSYLSQFSLSSFAHNLSGRSALSAVSHQTTYSVSRPWSRVSRRRLSETMTSLGKLYGSDGYYIIHSLRHGTGNKRWHDSTLNDPLVGAKTAWPVPYTEALFLPEFKIKGNITEKDFEVVSTVSKGAFGTVYKVIRKDTNEEYALKVLSKAQIIADSAVNQVKDEVRIQSTCGHHPFILNCPFFWQNKKQLFIVSEYMSGGELLDLCHNYSPLPEDLVRIYIAEIALAVDFLHNAGVIYRDLKLENILLDDDGHAQLIDFGLAKWLKYGARTSTICGTFQYMAPEVVSMKQYGHAVDWWSLGVVMCCLLTGEFPTPGVGESEAAPGTLPEGYTLSPAATNLLTRLLDKDPHTRLRSLLTLQGVAFFMDFNFSKARAKQLCPKEMLASYFPQGPPNADTVKEAFQDFDSGPVNS